MSVVVDVVAWVLIAGGGLFLIAGGIGVLRFPDFYTRLHAAGITDTMGITLTLLGLMVQEGFTLGTVKLLLILVFVYFTSPTATHATINAALVSGLRPMLREDRTDITSSMSQNGDGEHR